MREEFGLFSVECQKINPLAYFSILEGGSLHFDYVFHYIFQNNSLLLEKFHDIIAWRTLVKMKSKKRKCTLLIKLFLWLRNTFFHQNLIQGKQNQTVVGVNQVRILLVVSSTPFISAHLFALMLREQQGGKSVHSSNIMIQ